MTKNIAILIQSYEEVPYLLMLDKNSTENVNYEIINFGGTCLNAHLQRIHFKNIDVINNCSDYSKNYGSKNNLFRFIFNLKYALKLRLNFYELDRFDEIIFFTPLCAPHILPVIKYNLSRMCYVPVPLLRKKNFLTNDGLNTIPLKINDLTLKNILRLIVFRLFYGKETIFVKLGAVTRLSIADKLLGILKQNQSIFRSDEESLDEIAKLYQEYNYFPEFTADSLSKIAVFFDQHYEQRKIVFHDDYLEVLNKIIESLNQNGFKIFYKAHPGRQNNLLQYLPDYVDTLPSFVPSEFIGDKNTLAISATSGAIAYNNNGATSLSIVRLIPFIDPTFTKEAFELLKRKANKKIYVPSNITEFKNIIESFGDGETVSVPTINNTYRVV